MSTVNGKNNTIAMHFGDPRKTSDKDFSLALKLQLPSRGISAILGRSGAGKTTLLRCIAGLEYQPGELSVNGVLWQGHKHFLPTHKRPLGYVFQEPSLFSHLSIKANLAYAIKRAGQPPTQKLYQKIVALMAIAPLLDAYPGHLSGGEKQRVAIARALLIRPQILLMDEPLASLDETHKQEILPYLEQLASEFALPILYVSHSLNEISRLGDYLVVLERGKLAAQGPLTEVLSRLNLPAPLADDAGVIIAGRVATRDTQWHLAQVEFAGGSLWVRDAGDKVTQRLRLRILARDVSLTLEPSQHTSILNRLAAQVIAIAPDKDPAMARVKLTINHTDTAIIALITRRSLAHLQITTHSKVWAQVKSVAIVR